MSYRQLRNMSYAINREFRMIYRQFTSSKQRKIYRNDDEKMTHFGFQEIKAREKAKEVYTVFENVADAYDRMNDIMSFGIHRIWKDMFIQELGPTHGTRLLDSAGGTGDIALRYLEYLRNTKNPRNVHSHVTVCDINEHMLNVGKAKAKKDGWALNTTCEVFWQQADAEKLPFHDESFTAYTIAFGIRNVTHINKVLEEAWRILKPGGRFLCLEFSRVEGGILEWLYEKYSFEIVPMMGILYAGQQQPYQYLVESIRKFPPQEEFKNMITAAGFKYVTYKNLSGGIVAIHSGFKF